MIHLHIGVGLVESTIVEHIAVPRGVDLHALRNHTIVTLDILLIVFDHTVVFARNKSDVVDAPEITIGVTVGIE